MFQKYKTNLKQLNLPQYSFKIAIRNGSEMIFDQQRRKWVRLTPEEWVRQNFIRYLIHEGRYPSGLIAVEMSFIYNKLKRRADIVVCDRNGKPVLIVECKSSDVEIIDNEVFDQVNNYNREFDVPYYIVTNGLVHLAFKVNPESKRPEYLNVIPLYEDILSRNL
jgi:hypothetical protein